MRPIKLTISAFGPYASKQVIDFEELKGRNIFVISGKTGAGKTTIFDAISYALYGEASGESRETDSLRSHFADDNTETYVELEFELRGEKYTVNRVPKQKKKKARGEGYTEKSADATLTLPDGKVITKVKNVTDKIIEILGITREQFKQIVMLAQGEFKKLYAVDMVLPWISHIVCSFLPALVMCKLGQPMVEAIQTYLPMDGIAMKTLFTVGSLLPAVGVAILLKQVANSLVDFVYFFFGFALSAALGLNLVVATVIGGVFAVINYKIKMISIEAKAAAAAGGLDDDDEEDI